jgi:hypothetical protein
VPTDAAADSQIALAIKAAQRKIGEESGTVGGALAQAKQMLSTANGNATKAQNACSAAGGWGSDSMVPLLRCACEHRRTR